jgi:hypothetical protein
MNVFFDLSQQQRYLLSKNPDGIRTDDRYNCPSNVAPGRLFTFKFLLFSIDIKNCNPSQWRHSIVWFTWWRHFSVHPDDVIAFFNPFFPPLENLKVTSLTAPPFYIYILWFPLIFYFEPTIFCSWGGCDATAPNRQGHCKCLCPEKSHVGKTKASPALSAVPSDQMSLFKIAQNVSQPILCQKCIPNFYVQE